MQFLFCSLKRTAFCLMMLMLCIASCRKEIRYQTNELERQKFFSALKPLKPQVAAIKNDLLVKSYKKDFIKSLVAKAGYPIWDKASIKTVKPKAAARSTAIGDTVYSYVPFVKEQTAYVQAVMVARTTENETMYKMVFANDYQLYPATSDGSISTACDIALLFIKMEYDVFEHTRLRVKDNSIFNITAGRVVVANSTMIDYNEDCRQVEIWDEGEYSASCDCMEGQHYMFSIMAGNCSVGGGIFGSTGNGNSNNSGSTGGTDPSSSGSNGSNSNNSNGVGNAGGGGGGGISTTGNPAYPGPATTNNWSIDEPAANNGLSGPLKGLEPIEKEVLDFSDNWVTEEIKNPCIKKAYDAILSTNNSTFFKKMYNIFDTSTNIHLSFVEQDSVPNVYARVDTIHSSSLGKLAIASLNKNLLIKCSQEWVSYVLIHESAHAGMLFNTISWDSTLTQHENMILKYLDEMALNLKTAYPLLSYYDAYSICYQGFDCSIDGVVPNDVFLSLMIRVIKKKLPNTSITRTGLKNRGKEFTDEGSAGKRLNCK